MGAVLLAGLSAMDAHAGPPAVAGPELLLHAGLADVLLLLILLSAAGAAGVLAFRAWSQGRYEHEAEDGLPPLVFPTLPPRSGGASAASGAVPRAAPPRRSATRRAATVPPTATSRGTATATEASTGTAAAPRGASHVGRSGDGSADAVAAAPTSARARQRKPPPVEATAGNGSAGVSPDTTLQILPGRLEVVGGDAGHEEIRFIRGGGRDAVVTLGRSSGTAPDHVQLRSPAVSRMHVRMRFADGAWYVANLSQTNPALVNGEVLEAGERRLSDGDQLELGDVVMRFRA